MLIKTSHYVFSQQVRIITMVTAKQEKNYSPKQPFEIKDTFFTLYPLSDQDTICCAHAPHPIASIRQDYTSGNFHADFSVT
jgi:hypothetical protein